jgi:hypothetical protein
MQPPFSFPEVIYQELLLNDRSIFSDIGADIEDALTRDQVAGLRISDVGNCALQEWAKCHDELTLPRDPQTQWSRLMAGSMFGALLGRVFKAAMDRRAVPCELETEVAIDGIPGHIDVTLPTYRHVYELKSNYNLAAKGPSPSHWLQAGMYIDALNQHVLSGEGYTASVVMIQPTLAGTRPRLYEYPCEDVAEIIEQARRESFRLRRAGGAIVPPEPDVSPEEASWRCASCQYGRCGQNKNPLKGKVFLEPVSA